MLQVLIESSAPQNAGQARWAMASAVAHAALIGAAVVLTLGGGNSSGAADPSPTSPVVYVQPVTSQPRSAEIPSDPGSALSLPVSRIPAITLPAIPTFDPVLERIDAKEVLSNGGLTLRTSTPTTVTPGGVYTEDFVDRAVAARVDNGSPDYPAQLRLAAIEGEVAVRFVVDSAGRVEPSSIEILRATHALFGDAVRRWLARTRYVPAEVRGQPVRQLVEQKFSFSLRR